MPAPEIFKRADPVRVLRILGMAFKGWRADGCPNLSAAIAFYALLSLVPLIFLTLWGLSMLLPSSEQAFTLVVQQLKTFLPMIRPERFALLEQARRLADHGAGLGGAGLLAALVAAELMLNAISYALDRILLEGQPRRFLLARVKSFLMVLALGGAAVLSMMIPTLLSAGRSARQWVTDNTAAWIAAVVGWLYELAESLFLTYGLPLLVMTVAFALTYKTLTQAKILKRHALLAGALCAILFEAAKILFGYYMAHMARTNLIYGSLGSLILVLLWVYYASNVFLFCAELIKAMRADLATRSNGQLDSNPSTA